MHYTNKVVNAVQGNSLCLLSEWSETHKHAVWTK